VLTSHVVKNNRSFNGTLRCKKKKPKNGKTINMKKIILALLATGFISCALVSQQVQAATVTGDIDFGGKVAFDTKSLKTATKVVTWSTIPPAPLMAGFSTVTGVSGDFATYVNVGDAAAMAQPWTFSPSTPTLSLWSVGGFTFDLASSTIVTQTTTLLYITGVGTITGNGFDPTEGTWSFTSYSYNGSGAPENHFHFFANTTAVPDGGSAVALLGIALAGIEGARRLIRSRKA
jgi:hypothetical protein